MGGGDALAAGRRNGLDDGLIVSGGYGDHAGRTALGGGDDAVDGVDHGKILLKSEIFCYLKCQMHKNSNFLQPYYTTFPQQRQR